MELVKDSRVKGGRDAEGELASVGQRWRLGGRWGERKREGDAGGRRGKIERLRSTFLCKLTGLDAQLTGLFWQVSDGPYYYFTAGPLGPCISGHNRTGQAGKKNKEKWHGRRVKNTTLDFLPPQLAGSALSHSPGICCMLAVAWLMCMLCDWGKKEKKKTCVHIEGVHVWVHVCYDGRDKMQTNHFSRLFFFFFLPTIWSEAVGWRKSNPSSSKRNLSTLRASSGAH